jgi:hypothetical protein
MVLVVMLMSTGVFLWTLAQNTEYNQAVKQINQLDIERLNEKVTASYVNYTVSAGKVYVNVIVSNEGSLSAKIVTLWVVDTNAQTYGFNNTLDIDLNPGETIDFREDTAIVVTVPSSSPSHTFSSWFVTARGNTIPLEGEQNVIIAQLSQGIGSLALDFYTFRYFEYTSEYDLKNYPIGNTNFTIPHNTPIAFGILLTNLDPSKETIILDMHSQVWLYCPEVIGGTKAEPPVWYIVNVNENGTIQEPYSEISINYGEAKLIIFASKTPGTFSKIELTHQDYANKLFAVNLMLHGKLGDIDYGQNIPFVSVYCQG